LSLSRPATRSTGHTSTSRRRRWRSSMGYCCTAGRRDEGRRHPADVRMQSYEAILRDYYPPDRVILGVFPAAMPLRRPARGHLARHRPQNYGCTHFIVGREITPVWASTTGRSTPTISSMSLTRMLLASLRSFFRRLTPSTARSAAVLSAPRPARTMSPTRRPFWYQVREMLERGEILPEEFPARRSARS